MSCGALISTHSLIVSAHPGSPMISGGAGTVPVGSFQRGTVHGGQNSVQFRRLGVISFDSGDLFVC